MSKTNSLRINSDHSQNLINTILCLIMVHNLATHFSNNTRNFLLIFEISANKLSSNDLFSSLFKERFSSKIFEITRISFLLNKDFLSDT